MADLKSLKELLSEASDILDTAATEIRDVPLIPTKENIYRIGKALDLVLEVQRQIYKIDPSLEPEYLKRSSPFPTGVNRKFGEILLQASVLCDDKKYQDAISLYEDYISENPPEFFANMAKKRIARIKKDN